MHRFGSRHLLDLISSAYPGLVTYVDTDLKFLFVNDKFLDWYGVDPEKIIGKGVSELISEEEFLERKPYYDKALSGEVVKFFSRVNHKNLGTRETELTYYPDIEDGEVKGFVAIAYDITEQRRAEKIALENEARFRSLTEVMPQLIWIVDADGKAIFFNHNWPRVTNTTMEQNLGHGWLDVVHPEDRINAAVGWSVALKSSTYYEAEYRLKMANGTYRWHMARGTPIKNDRGEVDRWVGTTTDIEVQKNARVLADLERERFYSIFMQSPIVICVLNGPDHHFDLVNPPAKKFYGGRDLRGKTLKEALPELEAQGYSQLMDEVYHSGKGCFLPAKVISIRQLDGSVKEHYHDLFYEAIKDEHGLTTGILNMSVDVTEQVKALHSMEEALKTRDQFLSVASHELKTPLTTLKLQSQLTLRTLNRDGKISIERQNSLAHQTNDLVSKLNRLIDDMLDVSRIRTGKLALNKEEHELGDIVREVVFRLSLIFEAAGIPLPRITASERLVGEWDRFRLEQVISNLLTNAIRYGKGNPIDIQLSKVDNFASLSVKDHGHGISREDLERIFERFERAVHSSEVSGLGLGLFISREIIEAHSGKIHVSSVLGEGSTFSFKIPLLN